MLLCRQSDEPVQLPERLLPRQDVVLEQILHEELLVPAAEIRLRDDDFGMVALETLTNQYLGGDSTLVCSPETQTEIDRKVVELVKKEYARAEEILRANRAKLEELAKYLYENETITGEEFMQILNA